MAAGADAADDALLFGFAECAEGTFVTEDKVEIGEAFDPSDVVNVDEVEVVGLQAFHALFEESPGAFVGGLLGFGDEEDFVAELFDGRAHFFFGEPGRFGAVVGGDVEVSDAEFDGAVEQGGDVVGGDELLLDLCAADAESGDADAGSAEDGLGHGGDVGGIGVGGVGIVGEGDGGGGSEPGAGFFDEGASGLFFVVVGHFEVTSWALG